MCKNGYIQSNTLHKDFHSLSLPFIVTTTISNDTKVMEVFILKFYQP